MYLQYFKYFPGILFVIVSTNAIHEWDVGVAIGNSIQFFNEDSSPLHSYPDFLYITALTIEMQFDKQRLLFSDKIGNQFAILSLQIDDIDSKPYVLVRNQTYGIVGIAYDPTLKFLFWTNGKGRTISRLSLSSKNSIPEVIHEFITELPHGIAVDHCGRNLYWTNYNHTIPSIDRSSLDGNSVRNIISKNLFQPLSITVDQMTKRIYWSDLQEGIHFRIECSKLDGSDRKVLHQGIHQHPFAIAVDRTTIYWTDWAYKAVWSLPKFNYRQEPKNFHSFVGEEDPMGIVVRNVDFTCKNDSEVEDYYTEGPSSVIIDSKSTSVNFSRRCSGNELQDDWFCNNLGDSDNNTVCHNFCLHGCCSIINGDPECRCLPGWSGKRCQQDVCSSYCLNNGLCMINSDGPSCNCLPGYSGLQCEKDECFNYCLNDGKCGSTSEGELLCQCTDGWKGQRCEQPYEADVICKVYCEIVELYDKRPSFCICPTHISNFATPAPENSTHSSKDFTLKSCQNSEVVRILILLSSVCVIFALSTVFLGVKVCQLRKRPRIRKRIIVNKNVTPLASRPPPVQSPEQCEITIENCCNMNICETPCFEPNVRTPKSASKSDEKKNLLGSMEEPGNSAPCQKSLF